jgi:hypothetical protein
MARHNGSTLARAAKLRAEIHDFASELERKYGSSALSNPAGRTIEARKRGTCKISGEPIHVGDSITKTADGWVLSQHAGGAMENPRMLVFRPSLRLGKKSVKAGQGRFVQTPKSVREQDRYTAAGEKAYLEGGPGEQYLTSYAPIRKYQQVENPFTVKRGEEKFTRSFAARGEQAGDVAGIFKMIAESHPSGPTKGEALAYSKLLALGYSPQDIDAATQQFRATSNARPRRNGKSQRGATSILPPGVSPSEIVAFINKLSPADRQAVKDKLGLSFHDYMVIKARARGGE